MKKQNLVQVQIPCKSEHAGNPFALRKYLISDKCPRCGAKRFVKKWRGVSWDGSRRLWDVDCWENECGHIDKYSDVRIEAKEYEQN